MRVLTGAGLILLLLSPVYGFIPQGAATAGDFSELRKMTAMAASEQEAAAWNQVAQEKDLKKKAGEARKYLEEFPEGVFVPYAHGILAAYNQQEGNQDLFFEHGEKVIEKLPDDAILLAQLSSAYAEKQEADKAIERGLKALEVLLPGTSGDAQLAGGDKQRDVLVALAAYGAGTGYLFKSYTAGGDADLMASALQYLQQATEADPELDTAHFRLGFAYQLQNAPEKSLVHYARALVLEGPTAAMADQYLRDTYTKVHGNADGIQTLIAEQKKYLQDRVQR